MGFAEISFWSVHEYPDELLVMLRSRYQRFGVELHGYVSDPEIDGPFIFKNQLPWRRHGPWNWFRR